MHFSKNLIHPSFVDKVMSESINISKVIWDFLNSYEQQLKKGT